MLKQKTSNCHMRSRLINPAKCKRFTNKFVSWVLFITVTVWSIGAPLTLLVPTARAAAVDAISTVQWQASKDKIAVVFNNWVFNTDSGGAWGSSGALVAADFTVTGTTIESVTHDGGGRVAILDLADNVTDGAVTVNCAADSIYYENGDKCDSTLTATTLGGGGVAAVATTFAVSSIDPMGTSVEVEFNHPVMDSTAATNKANYELLTRDGGIDGFGNAANDTYTALNAAAVTNDTNVMVSGWSPLIVRVEAWNADINTARGTCSDSDTTECDKLKIKSAVVDIWGNTLAADSIQQIKFTSGGGGGAPMIEGVFVDDDKVVNTTDGTISTNTDYDTITIVYSEAMEETSAETASYYTLVYNDDGDCNMWNDDDVAYTEFLEDKVVRVNTDTNMVRFSVLNATYNIVGHNMSDMNTDVCPSNVKVAGGSWATVGPKDLDGNIQMDDMDRMIEVSTTPSISGVGVSGNTLRVEFSKAMDVSTVAVGAFTLTTASGSDDTTLTAATLDFDERTVVLTATNIVSGSATTIANNDTLVVSADVKDLLAQSVVDDGSRTYTFSTSNITAPTITRVKITDANSNNSVDLNDKVAILFDKNMDRYSAWSADDFELRGGTSCTITDPSVHADKDNCDEWGYWGDGWSLDWGDTDADGSEADSVDDGCDTGGTPSNNNCVVIGVGQYANISSGMKIIPWVSYDGSSGVSDTSGNTVSNVFTLSTAAASITNAIINPAVTGGTTTLEETDTATFFFSKSMTSSAVDATNVDTTMVATGSHTWGTTPTVQWGDTDSDGACDVSGTPASNDCLKITLGGSPAIVNGDIIDPTDAVIDTNGTAVSGTWTIATSGPVVSSIIGLTKLTIVFSESIANMSGLSYPDMISSVASYDNPSVDLSVLATLQTKVVYTGATITGLDYMSSDGKTMIIALDAAAEATDTINFVSLPADSGLDVTVPGTKTLNAAGYGASGGYNSGATTVTIAAGTAPKIEAVDIMTGGGFNTMDTTMTGGSTGALSPGTMVRIRFNSAMAMGSVTNSNVNTALPISGKSNPWGTAWTNVWWMSEGGVNNNVLEINVGDGATAAHGDTVGDIIATSESGTALDTEYNSFVIDSSMAGVDKMTFNDVDSSGTITASDQLIFEFNKSMNTSLDAYSSDGCETAIDADTLETEMKVDISGSEWYFYPINVELMGGSWTRRNRPFGTDSNLVMQWGKTATGTCNKLTITLGTAPTIASGDNIFFDPMWITTQTGKSIMTHDLTLDITAPTLSSVYLIDSDADNDAGTAGDILYFNFSKPIDQTTITAGTIATRLAVSSDDYGTPTLSWDSPTALSVTITATTPSSAISSGDTVTPTADIKDIKGNAIDIATTADVSLMTTSPVSSVVLTDLPDTTYPGMDKYDMRVTFAEPSDISSIDHYNVYVLPSDVALASTLTETSNDCVNSTSAAGGTACHRVNSSDISTVEASSTITYNLSTSSYAIYDDSRFSYIAESVMPENKNWYPFMPDKQYIAYVVGCLDDTCSSTTMAVGSTATSFAMEMMQFNFTDMMGKMGMGGTAGALPTTGVMAGGDFWVERTEPFSGSTDIPTNLTQVGIKFSQPLMESSIAYTNDCSALCVRKWNSSTSAWDTLTSGITTSYESDHFAVLVKLASGTLVASSEYEIKIAGAGSSTVESAYDSLIKSDFGMALPGDYYSSFTTGSGTDTTAPQIAGDKFTAEGIDWSNTGSSLSPYELNVASRVLEEIGVSFDKSMDPTTFTSSSVTLQYDGTYHENTAYASGDGETSVSGSVDYDPFDRTMHFWLDSALPTSKNFKLTISGTLVKDMADNRLDGNGDGVAGGDYTLYFNTSGNMDVTAPEITWADADGFHIGVGFNQPMKESTVTSSSNWTVTTNSGNIALSGASFHYDNFMNEVHIDGLDIPSDATYTLTAGSNIKGLNGTPISTLSTCYNETTSANDRACNVYTGTVHGFQGKGHSDCDASFAFGCSTDDVFHPDVMTFMPIDCWPMTMTAGQPSRYMINFPITQAIDHGGQVLLEFPSGFDISGAAMANKDTESFMNYDLNGPGTGIVRVRAVTGTADAGGSTTTLIDDALSATDDTYNNYVLFMTSGNNKNSYRTISDYTGSSTTITLQSAFSNAIAAGDTYEIQYISRNALANKITLTLDIDEDEDGSFADEAVRTSTTMANDFMSFELKGIVNGEAAEMDWRSFPPKGGYTVDITTKDSDGKTLDGPLTSMSFEIKKAGAGVVSGTVTKSDGTTGIASAKVFLDGPGGHQEKTTASNGSFTFSGLQVPTSSTEEWHYWLMVEPPETGSYFQGNGVEVRLTSTSTTSTGNVLKLKSGDSTISGKLIHESDLVTDGKKVRIWANGPEGWIEKELTLDGKQATSSSVRSETACDTTGLTTTGVTTPVCTEYIIDVLNGEWNIGVEPFFAMTKMTMGPPPEPPFMPPATQMIMVSTSQANVNFLLKSASLSITGTVADASGNALPGVEVWSHNSSGMFGFGAHSQTKADGTFKLKTGEGIFMVGVMIPGVPSLPEQTIQVATAGNTPSTLAFVINKAGTSVQGTIYDENGDPIEYAGISAFNSTTGMFIPAPAKTGSYTLYLDAGTWDIEAHAPGYGRLKTITGLDKYSVTVVSGTNQTGKDFSATGADVAEGEAAAVTYRTISGTIVDSNNTAVEGAIIYADEVDTTSNGKTGKGNKAVTNSDGEYTVKVPANTATSTYTIGAKTDVGELTEKIEIDVSSADSTSQNWSLAEQRAVSIDITGVPADITLEEVKVEAYNTGTMKGQNKIMEDVTTAANTDSVNMQGGTYDVKAYIPGFGQVSPDADSLTSDNFVVSGATTKTLTFDLSAITVITISGTVTDTAATPVPIENAFVGAFDSTTGIGNNATTDSSGDYTLKVACTGSCAYEVVAHGPGYLSDKYASNITATTADVDIALGVSDAVITGTLYKADGTTPATDAYVFAVEKDGDKREEAYPDASGQFTLNVDDESRWNIFAGTDDGKYGSLMNVDTEGTSDAEYDDITFNLDQDVDGFTQIDPQVETVTPSQGGRVTDEAKNQDMLDDLVTAGTISDFTYSSLDTADVITIDTVVTIDKGDLGNGDNAYTVMIETLPPLHSLDASDVLGVEKEVTVLDESGKEVSDLSSPVEIEMQYDKVDIKNIVDQSSDLTTTTVGASLGNLGASYWENEGGGSTSDWIAAPATKKVKVQAEADGTWVAVDFDTFIDNVDASDGDGNGFDHYNDFEIAVSTTISHLTPFGGILTGTGDSLAPSAPTSPSASGITATSVTLSWTAPTTNSDATALTDLQEYAIYRSTSSSSIPISGGSEDQRNSTTVTGTTFSDTIASGSAGYTYYYVITAYDDNGNQSVASSVVEVIYTAPGGGAPSYSSTSTIEPEAEETVTETVEEEETTTVSETVEAISTKAQEFAQKIVTILAEAVEIIKANINSLLAKVGLKRNLAKETNSVGKYVKALIKGATITQQNQHALTNFVTYGTSTTLSLGEGERAGVVNSYKSAFGKLPAEESEWSDTIKIANGRWPSETNETAETNAIATFKKIYLREPNRAENQNDDAAVVIMAYGLRPSDRNLDSEKAAIKIFEGIYGYSPVSATDWDAVRAISYSGATR
jgi:protocatechuate 3,4-dioxygenase beta subunit